MDLQSTNQIPNLLYPIIPYNTLTIPTIPALPYSCNKYCDLIGHSEVRGCGKRSQIVDLQPTNQIPNLLYHTLQYLTIPTIPALSYSCNKYCDLISHSEVRGCGKQSEIVDLQLTNQIPDLRTMHRWVGTKGSQPFKTENTATWMRLLDMLLSGTVVASGRGSESALSALIHENPCI